MYNNGLNVLDVNARVHAEFEIFCHMYCVKKIIQDKSTGDDNSVEK